MKKSAIALALGAAFAAGNAMAAVDLDVNPVVPVTVATEVAIDTSNGTTITNAGNALDVTATAGFGISDGSAYYMRFDLSNGAQFNAAPTLAVTDSAPGAAVTTLSQGGAGESYVIFSVTPSAGASVTTADTATLAAAAYDLFAAGDVSVTYAMYETAANAVNQTGALVTKSGTLIDKESGLDVSSDSVTPLQIDVTAESKLFVGGVDTTVIGDIDILGAANSQLIVDGATELTVADAIAAGTKLIVSGDFTATQNADGTYTGAALDRVFLDSDGNCNSLDGTITPADELSATTATFNIDDTEVVDAEALCMTVNGTSAIAGTTFTALYDVTAETGYNVSDYNLTLGTLSKNGSSDDLVFLLSPNGTFANLVRITNASSIAGDVFLTAYNDAGESVSIALGDVAGQATELAAQASTGLININDIYAALQAADASFDVNGGKLRMVVEGEFAIIDAQAFSLSTDGTTFNMMQ